MTAPRLDTLAIVYVIVLTLILIGAVHTHERLKQRADTLQQHLAACEAERDLAVNAGQRCAAHLEELKRACGNL